MLYNVHLLKKKHLNNPVYKIKQKTVHFILYTIFSEKKIYFSRFFSNKSLTKITLGIHFENIFTTVK